MVVNVVNEAWHIAEQDYPHSKEYVLTPALYLPVFEVGSGHETDCYKPDSAFHLPRYDLVLSLVLRLEETWLDVKERSYALLSV